MDTKEIGDYYHSKCIALKRPNKIIIVFIGIIFILGNIFYLLPSEITNSLFWISWIIIISMICVFYLSNKYYAPKSLKYITINENDIILNFFYIKDRTTNSHDYITQKESIKIVIKSNKMELLENGTYIAKVYKSTIKDKNDWEWLINYFSNK